MSKTISKKKFFAIVLTGIALWSYVVYRGFSEGWM